MRTLIRIALAVTAVATLSACAVVPPQVAYVGPRIAVVPAPAPYYAPVAPYYAPAPYYGRHHHHPHRGWY